MVAARPGSRLQGPRFDQSGPVDGAQAEDAFLEADTDGSGSIDEDECLALFEKLTSNQQADVLAEYMRSFRTSPDTPLDLEFDQFVHVYNSFLEKWGQ